MKFEIVVTISKIIAILILVGAYKLGANVFMFSLPFVVFLITGKQITDKFKPNDK